MQRKAMIVAIASFLLLGVILHAQGITVTSPNGGELWTKGKMKSISWTTSGITSGTYQITLWKNGTSQGVIATGLSHPQNQFEWTVGKLANAADAAAGSGYTIKVRLQGQAYNDFSNAPFSIRHDIQATINIPKVSKKKVIPATLFRQIEVSSPVKDGDYSTAKPIEIKWNPDIGNQPKVHIYLHDQANDQRLETIALNHDNSGVSQWVVKSGYGWPGQKYYVRIQTPDNTAGGRSGAFGIHLPQKKQISLPAQVTNHQVSVPHNNTPEAECLFVSLPQPGRAANDGEIKSGHFKREDKTDGCYWGVEYHFTSDLAFALAAIKGKQIVRAELSLTLSDEVTQGPTGTWATNQFCNSESLIKQGDDFLCSFSIYAEGGSQKVDLLSSLQDWAAHGSGTNFTVSIKGKLDNTFIPNSNSVCLKYYTNPVLVVEYMD